jgi:hypothetical protein
MELYSAIGLFLVLGQLDNLAGDVVLRYRMLLEVEPIIGINGKGFIGLFFDLGFIIPLRQGKRQQKPG